MKWIKKNAKNVIINVTNVVAQQLTVMVVQTQMEIEINLRVVSVNHNFSM